MDPFHLCVALGPVAVYLLLIGAVNLLRRPFVVSGTRDAAAMGLAVSGLVIVGPVELFFPIEAAIRFGSLVWLLLVALYGLTLVLVLLTLRPRLVIYNISLHELRPILAELVAGLDADARWAGDGLILPNLGVQLHLESLPALRNVSLVSTGRNQSYQGWWRLEAALRAALGQVEVPRNPRGYTILSAGLFLIVCLVAAIISDWQSVARSLFDVFRR